MNTLAAVLKLQDLRDTGDIMGLNYRPLYRDSFTTILSFLMAAAKKREA